MLFSRTNKLIGWFWIGWWWWWCKVLKCLINLSDDWIFDKNLEPFIAIDYHKLICSTKKAVSILLNSIYLKILSQQLNMFMDECGCEWNSSDAQDEFFVEMTCRTLNSEMVLHPNVIAYEFAFDSFLWQHTPCKDDIRNADQYIGFHVCFSLPLERIDAYSARNNINTGHFYVISYAYWEFPHWWTDECNECIDTAHSNPPLCQSIFHLHELADVFSNETCFWIQVDNVYTWCVSYRYVWID